MPRISPEATPAIVYSTNRYSNYYTGETYSYSESTTSDSGHGVARHWRAYSGTTTPDFQKKKATGTLPNNSYQVTINRNQGTGYSLTTVYNGFRSKSTCSTADAVYTFTPFQLGIDDGRVEADNKAFKQLSGKLSGVRTNAALILAERKKTADLIYTTAHRVAQAAIALKRGRLSEFTNSLSLPGHEARSARSYWKWVDKTPPEKRLASHWLEFIYGWRPLLMDIHDSAEYLAQRINAPQRDHGTVTATASVKKTHTDPNWADAKLTYASDLTRRYVLSYELESAGVQILSQTGISNPLALGWELMPYSFVIDWFLPVGNFLESLTAFDGFTLNTSRSYLVTKKKASYTLSFARRTGSVETNNYLLRTGAAVKSQFQYTREGLSTFPSYTLQAKSPIGGEPLSRFVTAVSLLTTAFARDPSRGR